MATLLVVYTSDGVIGRCDAKCYDAKPGSECDCICGGVNHGQGLAEALCNVKEALGNAEAAALDLAKYRSKQMIVAAQLGLVIGDMTR
jgi:predicted RNase H-like HicB family nuclease